MIPIASEVKKADVQAKDVSRSTAVANSNDGVQNIVRTTDIRLSSNAGTIDTRIFDYVGFIRPTATDYPNATIGSTYLELKVDSGVTANTILDAVLWRKTAAGWVSQDKQERIRVIKTFGSTDSQYDVSLRGNNIVRYTYDGTGTTPAFVAGGLKTGDKVTIGSGDFASANQGTFEVLTVAATYIEVYNASGVAESNVVTDGAPITSYLTLELTDDTVLVNNTANTTVVLPTAVGCAGKKFTIKNLAAGVVTVDGNASETIEGAATVEIFGANEFLTIISDGANWKKVASSRVECAYTQYILGGGAFDNANVPIAKMIRAAKVVGATYYTSAALGSGVGIDIIDGGSNGAGTDVICASADNLAGLEADAPTSSNFIDAAHYLNVKADNFDSTQLAIVNVTVRFGCDV